MHFYHRRIGAVDELFPIAEHAARIAPRLGGIAPIVAAQAMLGVAHHLKGNLAEAHRDSDRGPRRTAWRQRGNEFLRLPSRRRSADCTYALAPGISRPGRPSGSAMPTGRRTHKDPITACLGLMWGVSVHYLRGDWATTDDYIERMLAIASEHGFLPYKWFAMATSRRPAAPTRRHRRGHRAISRNICAASAKGATTSTRPG